MNTKSNKIIINPEFSDLFTFESAKDKLEHNAQMISFKILSEVERVCDERKLKKKDLAEKIGTSKSYITQLFRGNKSVNTMIMAKFEDVLNISFQIEATFNDVATKFIGEKFNINDLQARSCTSRFGTWYFCTNKNASNDIVEKLKTNNINKEAA